MPDSLRSQLQASLGAAYTLERELGGGGMSRVFVAEELRFGRKVVVKVLAPELAEALSAERFGREIALAAALQEPHIVSVLDAGMTGAGLPWYTMPFVRGESLRARLERGSVPLAESVGILRDVARALAYAHGQGVVHRDIKPENVLLHEGTAVVTDFGIAKAVSAAKRRAPEGTLTVVGTSLGTPAYMAPEQAVGDAVDHRADLYAWGVMAYELLVGTHPFATKTTAQQLIAAHIAEPPRPLREVAPTVPTALADVVMRALEKDPATRPASASGILDVLDTARAGEGARRAGRRWASRLALGALAALVLGGAVGFVAWMRRAPPAAAPTIAVLPFEHRGPAEHAYFADGLGDAVNEKLVGVPGLTVIDRRSAAMYKGTSKTATQIGNELGVAHLLEGTVTWAKDAEGVWRAQVRPTLVRTRDGGTEWVGALVVTPTDPFAAQAEIAGKVVAEIGVAIGPRERAALATAPTTNAEAYELYLRARALARVPAQMLPAPERAAQQVQLLERATTLDPAFALAFAELANIEAQRPSSSRARSDAALARALALDPALPEAHHIRAGMLWYGQRRFADGLAAATRASALRPGDATILSRLATFQLAMGQIDEGFANLERTVMLDPLNMVSNRAGTTHSWFFRRFDAAERHARRMIAIAPTELWGYNYLTRTALSRGDTAGARRAIAESERGLGRPVMGANIFWMLPLSFTTAPGALAQTAAREPVPVMDRSESGGDVREFVFLGAWARETGQPARARAWFDSALASRSTASQEQGQPLRAIALAGAGRAAEARRAIASADSLERATALPNKMELASAQDLLAYAHLMLGERDAAISRLERVLALPSGRTPAMLRTMWPYRSLHGDPRFRRLAEMRP